MMVYRRLSERRAEEKRAELERDWMTLVEATELVQRVDAVSKVELARSPYEQICDAIEDGELRARWLDETPPPRGPQAWGIPLDKPQNFIGVLRRPKLRLQNGGEILCGHPLHPGRSLWRKLLLSREDMQRLFGSAGIAPTSIKKLRPLANNPRSVEAIHEAISAVYDLAQEQKVRPPNLREIIKPVQEWLKKHKDVSAKGSWIENLAADERYKSRRGKPGVRVGASLRPLSDLQI
jgi:hypothetical protein